VSRNPSFFYAFTPRGIPHFVRNDCALARSKCENRTSSPKCGYSTSSTVVVDFRPCSSCNGILETMIPLAKIFA